jgi:hypothetical protein
MLVIQVIPKSFDDVFTFHYEVISPEKGSIQYLHQHSSQSSAIKAQNLEPPKLSPLFESCQHKVSLLESHVWHSISEIIRISMMLSHSQRVVYSTSIKVLYKINNQSPELGASQTLTFI